MIERKDESKLEGRKEERRGREDGEERKREEG